MCGSPPTCWSRSPSSCAATCPSSPSRSSSRNSRLRSAPQQAPKSTSKASRCSCGCCRRRIGTWRSCRTPCRSSSSRSWLCTRRSSSGGIPRATGFCTASPLPCSTASSAKMRTSGWSSWTNPQWASVTSSAASPSEEASLGPRCCGSRAAAPPPRAWCCAGPASSASTRGSTWRPLLPETPRPPCPPRAWRPPARVGQRGLRRRTAQVCGPGRGVCLQDGRWKALQEETLLTSTSSSPTTTCCARSRS
mmetsp:Transcript_25325/g.84577  ORF Transcript_25325/g.84577 Transcript_25325/m.84577 type:complete len:249 (-) Transcript_25325:1200-1946(-)